MKNLAQVESFGGIDADTDTLLGQCFQDHEAYLDAVSHKKPFLVGRKGSGKTAIFKKLIQTRKHDVFSFGHTFTDYPWHHHKLQELIGVPEELRYVQSWLYLILVTSAKILLNQDQSQPWNETALNELDRLQKFVVDSYGTRDPDLTQLFTPAKRLRIMPHLKLAKGFLEAGMNFESLPVSELPKVVQEVNRNIGQAIIECLNPAHDYFICFDELDRGFDPKDPQYLQMLVGLLLAAKYLNAQASAGKKKLSVLVFLRDDIYQMLRFEDKNKITENLVSRIEWDSERTRWTLRELMEKRFTAVVGEGSAVTWGSVFDENQEMPGRQTKYQHILDRTFRRPRDIIKFCNEVLGAFKRAARSPESRFANEDVIAARPPYSEYLMNELEDEIHKHISDHSNYLEVLRSIGAAQFSRDELDQACTRRADLVPTGKQPLDILRQLFDFSIVAYQRTGGVGGGSEYVWRHLDARARFDEAAAFFRVHPGLVESLGLKKFTAKRGDASARPTTAEDDIRADND